MIFKSHSKKSWRHFSKRKRATHKIRKFCYAALILEAALAVRDVKAAGIHMAEEEVYKKIFTEKNRREEEPDTIFEQCFGFHVRIKEGVIEFYRKEEKYRITDQKP